MRSLQARLVVWVALAAFALTAASGATLYLMARAYLLRRFDASMQERATLLASLVKRMPEWLVLNFDDANLEEFESIAGGGYVQLRMGGETLYRSPSLRGMNLPPEPGEPRWLEGQARGQARLLTLRFEPEREDDETETLEEEEAEGEQVVPLPPGTDEVELTLSVAGDAGEVVSALRALRWGLLGVGLGFAACLAGVVSWGVRRGLRPVHRLTQRLGEVDERTLDRPLEASPLPRELRPIVMQFNALLGRLSTAFERERSFSSNLAHELRTPLAGLRTTLEVALARPRSADEARGVLERCLSVTGQMQAMVEGLMQLATLERNAEPTTPVCGPSTRGDRKAVDFNAAVEAVWVPLRDAAATRRVHMTQTLAAEREVVADPALLNMAIRNVLHNAVSYVDPGGRIEISSKALDAGGVELRVVNSGSRVPAGDADKVFDRFWRGDASRTGVETTHHFGLGLPLTRLAVQTLGGTLSVRSEEGGDFEVTMRVGGGRES